MNLRNVMSLSQNWFTDFNLKSIKYVIPLITTVSSTILTYAVVDLLKVKSKHRLKYYIFSGLLGFFIGLNYYYNDRPLIDTFNENINFKNS